MNKRNFGSKFKAHICSHSRMKYNASEGQTSNTEKEILNDIVLAVKMSAKKVAQKLVQKTPKIILQRIKDADQ